MAPQNTDSSTSSTSLEGLWRCVLQERSIDSGQQVHRRSRAESDHASADDLTLHVELCDLGASRHPYSDPDFRKHSYQDCRLAGILAARRAAEKQTAAN